jgi:F-type H+-transporting ATP synthase subunit e
LRWSALAVGVFYGFSHQRTLRSQEKIKKIDSEFSHKQSLIDQARAEWAKKSQPASKQTGSGDRMSILSSDNADFLVITDPNDSKFDLEAFLNAKFSESSKH